MIIQECATVACLKRQKMPLSYICLKIDLDGKNKKIKKLMKSIKITLVPNYNMQ